MRTSTVQAVNCPACGSDLLAEVRLPEHPKVIAIVCLACTSLVPVEQEATA